MGNPITNKVITSEFTGFTSKNERILQRICAKLESVALYLEEDHKRLGLAEIVHECVEQLCELEVSK